MDISEPSETWLQSANERYRQQQLHPMRRPFEALRELSMRCGPIAFGSPIANKVFAWFGANVQSGCGMLGPMFTGVFYYDVCFWPITIPVFYGRVSINPSDAVKTMPKLVSEGMWKDRTAKHVFLAHWCHCFDYAYGLDLTLKSGRFDAQTISFLENGDKELRGAIVQLLTPRPNLKAILGFRMACEIFLKAFLIQEKKLNDKELRKLGHNISTIAQECFSIVAIEEFEIISKTSQAFPDVSDRYDGVEKPRSEVWDAVFIAQIAAATITRHYSGQDIRSQIFKNG